MADAEDDEQFLYGDDQQDKGQSEKIKTELKEEPTENGTVEGKEEDDSKEAGELSNEDDEEEDDDDDDDDDVQVTIGEINTSATGYGGPYGTPVNWNFKGGSASAASKATPAGSGSKSIDVNAEGTVNGVGIYEFDLETAEERPWRKPGADITDYFNYGFTEDTWKQYCEKQRRMRLDLSLQKKTFTHHVTAPAAGPVDMGPPMIPMEFRGPRKAGPPPERKLEGSIDVIGAIGSRVESRRQDDDMPPHIMDGGPPDMDPMHGRRFPPGPGGGLPPGAPPPFRPPPSDPNMDGPPMGGPPPTSGPPTIPVHHGMPPQFPPGRHDMPPPGAPPGMLPPGMVPPPHGLPPGFPPDQGHMPFDPLGRGRGRGRGQFPHGIPGLPPGMDERARMGFEEGMPPFFPGDPMQPFAMMGPPPGMPWDAGLGRGFVPNFGRDGFPVGMRPGGESPGRMRSDDDSEYGSSEDERKREREHKKRDKDKDRERGSREHRERTRDRHSDRDRSPRRERDRERRDRDSSRRHRDRDKDREKGSDRERDREKREERSSRRERSKDTREKKRHKGSSEAASTDGQEEGELVSKKKSRRSREEKKEAKAEAALETEEGQLSS